jgi:hypothetical protein
VTPGSEEIKGIDVAVENEGDPMHVESASRWPQRDQSHTAASIIADVLAPGVVTSQPAL